MQRVQCKPSKGSEHRPRRTPVGDGSRNKANGLRPCRESLQEDEVFGGAVGWDATEILEHAPPEDHRSHDWAPRAPSPVLAITPSKAVTRTVLPWQSRIRAGIAARAATPQQRAGCGEPSFPQVGLGRTSLIVAAVWAKATLDPPSSSREAEHRDLVRV